MSWLLLLVASLITPTSATSLSSSTIPAMCYILLLRGYRPHPVFLQALLVSNSEGKTDKWGYSHRQCQLQAHSNVRMGKELFFFYNCLGGAFG